MNHCVKRIRRSENQIRSLLDLREEKNISVAAFCKAHKIHKATFYNWRNKYGLEIKQPQEFLRVQLSDNLSEAVVPFAEIEFTSKVIVRLFQKVDASYFKSLQQP
ncbi:MAG: transposase [Segetibacter sp.]|nr:transposase [Segetibacter sp.]